MNLREANEKIQNLISLGLTTRQLLVLAAHYRRIDLEKKLSKQTDNKIIDGPFKGVEHLGEAHGSTLCPKILGTYEQEISQHLQALCSEKVCFIDIGCAEGYYTTGIGVSTNIPLIIGVDISASALAKARESANLNNIGNKCQFFLEIQPAARLITGKSLIMIDVDGSEIPVIQELFNELSPPQTQSIELIIETDFKPDGSSNEIEIKNELRRNNFHVTEIIEQSIVKRFSPATELLTTSFLDRVIYGLEGRPLNQKWLIGKSLTL